MTIALFSAEHSMKSERAEQSVLTGTHPDALSFQGNDSDQLNHRLLFLSEVSYQLSFALTDQECFQKLTELMVPALADMATIALLTEDQQIKRICVAHVDPEKAKMMSALLTEYPVRTDDVYSLPLVIRTRKSLFEPDADSHVDDDSKQLRYPGLAEMYRSLNVKSAICVPFEAHGQVIGSLWVATSVSGRRFQEDHLKLFEEIASRASPTALNMLRLSRTEKALDRLQLENEVRETFISQVRHDVLSALTAATLSAQLIAKGMAPDRDRTHAQRIINTINRASEILKRTREQKL
jgi:GAF domain-containing protein